MTADRQVMIAPSILSADFGRLGEQVAEAEAADHGQDLDNNMRRNAKALKRWKEICDEEGVEHNTGVGGLFTPSDTTGDSGE